ncbi:MAG: NlpC/P60 family protein [Armatimonadota bacterium]
MRFHVGIPAVILLIVVLSVASPAMAAKTQRPATETYQIRQGDSLWTVARRYGTTAEQLARMNGLSTEATLSIGQRLNVPAKVGSRSASRARTAQAGRGARLAPAAPVGGMTAVYQVRSGDTLWTLARRHRTTSERLAAMNGVSAGAILSIGRRLRVPAAPAPATPAPAARGPATPAPAAPPAPAPVVAAPGTPAPNVEAPAVSPPPAASPEVQQPAPPAATDTPPAAAVRPRASTLPSRGPKWSSTVVALSTRFLGVRYRWGGTSPDAFDCSGLMYYVFAQTGVALPRTTFDMFEAGTPVPSDQLQTGDIVFFQTLQPGPSHAGIYLGDGRFIHSSSGFGRVTITPMNHRYYAPRYLGARRF